MPMPMPMPKAKRACSCGFPFLRATLLVLLIIPLVLWYTRDQLTFPLVCPTITHSLNNTTNTTTTTSTSTSEEVLHDPPYKTFYDDPELSYSIEKPLRNWDEKRSEWLRLHPLLAAGARDRILLITGSQPSQCENPIGDHLLLRTFKNKVDYCRIHGCEVWYNNLLVHPKMGAAWAKLPAIRSAMMANPDVEWIWWMDTDAVFTDMEFKLPLDRYKNHNLVLHGTPEAVYGEGKNKSWLSLNAGAYLIRNCQWSMDLMHVWAQMGPITTNYEKWGKIQQSIFFDKDYPFPDDQSSLIYLLFRERRKWGGKTYLEEQYRLEDYWMLMYGRYEGIDSGYYEMEEEVKPLRRRHAEKLSLWYSDMREHYLKQRGWEPLTKERRPFVTHFTGCQPCNGHHNPIYDADTCWKEMNRALNFADNQVLRNYGFLRKDLASSLVYEVPFDFPWNKSINWETNT